MTEQCNNLEKQLCKRKAVDKRGMTYQVENFLNIIKYAIHKTTSTKLPELQKPVDWVALAKMAKAHNLFALFHEVAYKFPEYRESAEYEQNAQIAMRVVAHQIQKTEMFLELYRAFLKENIHPIVMKGIICRQLYGEYAEHRPSGDEDILVKQNEFYEVKSIMEKCGFYCTRSDVTEMQLTKLQDVGFYEKESNFLIEVHINIMGHINETRSRMGACFQDVFMHTKTISVCGIPITTMSHTEHYLFLVLHAFKHFSLSGVGVRQMLDILLYQNAYEKEINWSKVRDALEVNHANSFLGDLQFIGSEYLGIEIGIYFKTCCPENLLDDLIEVGVFGKSEEVDELAARINLNIINQKKKGISTWVRVGFPNKKFMTNAAPYLEEKPWMLPVEWVKRWCRFYRRAKKYGGSLMLDGVKKSKERMELLKKYGL